ncbi:nuclear transport factor 2 family protein [Motilimonas cestriensis]|uniref:Nuclear transport factor 2 family protein n=1 Tax=Motilimonas cestriensis TaxID=2742685 RepID=A0ABS8WAY3_9GAMM|nr:nuclear transport factor 2 family protein [Motilimonas cestriensis]
MKSAIISQFVKLYQQLDKHNLERLGEVYDPKIQFVDALHEVNGLVALTEYFAGLYHSLEQCDFVIHEAIQEQQQASIFWVMTYRHPKLNGGKAICVNGASHLKFTDKITYHRDYVDLGEMLYENIPMLGACIRQVKKRAKQ